MVNHLYRVIRDRIRCASELAMKYHQSSLAPRRKYIQETLEGNINSFVYIYIGRSAVCIPLPSPIIPLQGDTLQKSKVAERRAG